MRYTFYYATCVAALAVVSGLGGIYLEFRDRTSQFVGPTVLLSAGIALIVFAFLSEKSGRGRRVFIHLRNALIVGFVLTAVLALLFIFFGPLH
jgi:hypothetical protein